MAIDLLFLWLTSHVSLRVAKGAWMVPRPLPFILAAGSAGSDMALRLLSLAMAPKLLDRPSLDWFPSLDETELVSDPDWCEVLLGNSGLFNRAVLCVGGGVKGGKGGCSNLGDEGVELA